MPNNKLAAFLSLFPLDRERQRRSGGERGTQTERRMEKESKTERQKEGGRDLVCMK